MQNLAGNKGCDHIIEEELIVAGIKPIRIEREHSEVPYTFIGKLGSWTFKRAWYYWMATTAGPGIPLADAQIMHNKPYPGTQKNYGNEIRVAGHCGCPPPEEWARPNMEVLWPQLEALGYTEVNMKTLRELLADGTVTGDTYVDNYHIDSQEGLNEFVRTVKRVEGLEIKSDGEQRAEKIAKDAIEILKQTLTCYQENYFNKESSDVLAPGMAKNWNTIEDFFEKLPKELQV